MSRALLDVNVLVALFDSDHVDHAGAREWLEGNIESGWASCAITQNGFVRIVSQPRYPSPISPVVALERLATATSTAHHAFWPCSVSLADQAIIDRERVHGPRQITDLYLLALAVGNGGRFVTFDRSIDPRAVHNADESHLCVL